MLLLQSFQQGIPHVSACDRETDRQTDWVSEWEEAYRNAMSCTALLFRRAIKRIIEQYWQLVFIQSFLFNDSWNKNGLTKDNDAPRKKSKIYCCHNGDMQLVANNEWTPLMLCLLQQVPRQLCQRAQSAGEQLTCRVMPVRSGGMDKSPMWTGRSNLS